MVIYRPGSGRPPCSGDQRGGYVARHIVVGDLRVQQIDRRDGRRSWTIVWPEGTVHAEADRFLRVHDGSGTQRTYAYLLVDHLRWLERECLALDRVELRDLERYMGIVGAEVRMPLGEPWRVGKRPYGQFGAVHRGGLPEGLLPASGRARCQRRAGQEAGQQSGCRRGRTAAGLSSGTPRRRCRRTRWRPAGPHRRHPKMLPDGAQGQAAGDGEHGSGPAGG